MTPADESIADWMDRRRREVEGFSEAEAKGLPASGVYSNTYDD